MVLYKIVLDLNMFRSNPEEKNLLFNEYAISGLKNFLTENSCKDVLICAPRVVILERIFQVIRDNRDKTEKIKELSGKLHPAVVSDFRCVLDKLQPSLEKEADDFIKKLGIYVIESPELPARDLLFRSLMKAPPFKQGDGDAGLKDTLLWLSILADARSGGAHHILCSHDGDFKSSKDKLNKEYSQASSSTKLEICDNFDEVKSFLDIKLELRLHYKEMVARLSNSIGKHIGTIMRKINSTRYVQPTSYLGINDSIFYSASSITRDISAFNFVDFSITNVDEKEGGTFEVSLTLNTEAAYTQKQSSPFLLSDVGYFNALRKATFAIVLVFNESKGIEEIKSISFV